MIEKSNIIIFPKHKVTKVKNSLEQKTKKIKTSKREVKNNSFSELVQKLMEKEKFEASKK